MFEKRKLKNWSLDYWNHIERNIGLISIEEQEKLRMSKVAIFGTGGLGGSIAEQLVRTGCESLAICDNDRFESSNLNRQLCIRDDLGKFKVDVLKQFLENINPKVKVDKFYEVNELNIKNILKGAKIVALTLDDPLILILISRTCKELGIPMIESYAVPYLFAWWFTPDGIDYEVFYNLSSKGIPYSQLKQSTDLNNELRNAILRKLLKIPNISNFFDREKGTVDAMLSGKIPFVSLAPIVRLAASFLTFEIIYSGILKIKKKSIVPNLIVFDYFNMEFFNK